MTEKLDYISGLIEKHLQNRLTDAEKTILEQWIKESSKHEAFFASLSEDKLLATVNTFYQFKAKREKIALRIAEDIPEFNEPVVNNEIEETSDSPVFSKPVHRVHFFRRSWVRYAAAIILLLGVAGIWYMQGDKKQQPVADIVPGTNRAILTIGSGQPISLSNNKTGISVGSAITYNDGEKIADAGQTLQLATPRGGQYQAVLPDGSKVWLNAASSIKFPSKFNKERRVEITGEVYFEIAKDPSKPFYVQTPKDNIAVLGTAFNTNSYPDEPNTKTSLIEGSIKVNDKILKPGEAYQNGERIKTNIEQDIAWKSGLFNFNDADLQMVMRQLSRWYDIDIKYTGAIPPSIRFKGEMDRGLYLSDVLEFIKVSGVQFKLEGKTLTILQYN